MSRTPYDATKMGDTALSPPIYACKYCGTRCLSWGVLGPYRRLFSACGVVHECRRGAEKEKRCACEGFGDFTIPIEHYNDHRFERRA